MENSMQNKIIKCMFYFKYSWKIKKKSAKYPILLLRYTSIASELHTGGAVFPNCSCFPSAFPRDHLIVNSVLIVLLYPLTVISPYNLFCSVLFIFGCYVKGLHLSAFFCGSPVSVLGGTCTLTPGPTAHPFSLWASILWLDQSWLFVARVTVVSHGGTLWTMIL